jgi:hypothetical protein
MNMEQLNFTQFCIKYGYPCDYDTTFRAQILGSRGYAGTISKRSISKQDEEFHKMQWENKKAHEIFYEKVKTGEIIDISGDLTQEKILEREKRINDENVSSKIDAINRKISFIESLGTMSHLKNGKLKKGYQSTVDLYMAELEKLTSF